MARRTGGTLRRTARARGAARTRGTMICQVQHGPSLSRPGSLPLGASPHAPLRGLPAPYVEHHSKTHHHLPSLRAHEAAAPPLPQPQSKHALEIGPTMLRGRCAPRTHAPHPLVGSRSVRRSAIAPTAAPLFADPHLVCALTTSVRLSPSARRGGFRAAATTLRLPGGRVA